MKTRLPLLICVWGYCLSWAFDYRAAEGQGGSPQQYLFFATTLVSSPGVVLLGFRRLFALPMGWILLAWGFYLFSTLVVAGVNQVEPGWYFRNTIPQLLLFTSLFTSLCVTQVAAACGLNYRHVLWPMLIAGVVNVFRRMFYAYFVAKIDPERIRVELLSPCLPFLMAYLFCGLALSRRLALMVGAVGALSYGLSITRSAVMPKRGLFTICSTRNRSPGSMAKASAQATTGTKVMCRNWPNIPMATQTSSAATPPTSVFPATPSGPTPFSPAGCWAG